MKSLTNDHPPDAEYCSHEGPHCKSLLEGETLGGKYEGNYKGEGEGQKSTLGVGGRETGRGGVRVGFASVEIRRNNEKI